MILHLTEKQLERKQQSVNAKAQRLMTELMNLEETYRHLGYDIRATRCNEAYFALRELPKML